MSLKHILWLTVLLTLLSHPLLGANDTEDNNVSPKKDRTWQGNIQLGGLINTGNSNNTTITAGAAIKQRKESWRNSAGLNAEFARSQGATTTEYIRLFATSRYLLSERDYLFAKVNFTYDKFAPFDIILTEAVGYGRTLFKSDHASFNLEAGPGGSHRRIAGDERFQNTVILNVGGFYEYQISETAAFSQALLFDIDHINTHIEAISALTTKVAEHFSLEISFRLVLVHDTMIPVGSSNTRKTDTMTKFTIVYEF